jgi:two-component system cell cycle sensor histidine kinase/response regulator CckA
VPIVYGEDTIGLISVGNREGGYAEEHKNLLERIASRVSPILHARLQRDIQERRRMAAEAHLRESEEKYRLLVTNADEAIFIIQDGAIEFPNPKAIEMTGYSADDLADISIIDLVHAADKATVQQRYVRLREGEQPAEAYPFRIVDQKGKDIWVRFTTTPIIWEKKPGTLCFLTDVTEEKKLEAQFMQAQKMEAVGRLAGGVAHDFNNMLTLIMGHVEMVLADLAPSDQLRAQLLEVDKAARRSAGLTAQLLAYARKQVITPRVLDLNDTVSGMLKMLRRLIGENIDLVWRPGDELWSVKIDPSQIDQVVANLCVNARDAITGVGKVTIETGNIIFDEAYCAGRPYFVPGEYVLLAVSDDGCGMDEETRTHLFEPFFTTKSIGQGTGLGLATVYGIVKQNDGFINVYSEPGQGTTFKIYFAAHRTAPDNARVEGEAKTPPGGTETVLMVEDEKEILDLGKKILEKFGYRVLIANTPREAIRLVEAQPGDIHLLITDVVMPEMNGRELAERLVSMKPGLKCLYMSGYTLNVIAHRGILEEGVHFIQKPFSIKDLADRVRETLDRKSIACDG